MGTKNAVVADSEGRRGTSKCVPERACANLKTVVAQATVGSNPTPSAKFLESSLAVRRDEGAEMLRAWSPW